MNNSSDDSTMKKTNGAVDQEGQIVKLKYPKSVAFIISNEFCERFNYYGMRTILVLYLNTQLLYSKNDSTVIFHAFAMLVYFMCVFGALISDSWLGKFRTILYLSIVYAIGSVVVSLGAVPPLKLPADVMTLVGLLLIAIGSGGIKPCVAAFGGDQFKLPEQARQMATFFSLFYFSINLGSLISTTVTPILRKDVHCFDKDGCYSLAFGVPAILMAVSIVVFILGRPLYISKPAEGNMFVLVAKTIGTAISTRCKEGKYNPKPHWLDYAEIKHDRDLIEDVKVLLRVLVLYIPLPVFWALFDQQGSRWTFQATQMDPVIGSFEVKPEHVQMINPFLILVFIPLYDVAFYPLLSKIGIRRPLQKLTCGGILAGVAFVISGIVELQLENGNRLSILWIIPQFFVMTLGEVMFSVTGLEFSYAQAPSSMKSVLQACWQLTVACGNLIVIIVAETKIFSSQANEFFLFAGLMFADMLLFMFLAYRYKPNNRNMTEEEILPKLSRAKADAFLNE